MDGTHRKKHVHESKLLEVDAIFGTRMEQRGVDAVEDWLEGPAGSGVVASGRGGEGKINISPVFAKHDPHPGPEKDEQPTSKQNNGNKNLPTSLHLLLGVIAQTMLPPSILLQIR